MLLPGTQMHILTFIFSCVEIVVLFYLIIYRIARPDDFKTNLNIGLITLLIIYNITGGLLPDEHLPGSIFLQETIAYATGFIAPCYFPFYVYKGFDLKKMHFHAYRGVYLCLILPFAVFVVVYAITGNLETANNILVIPVLYAIWVIIDLRKALRFKYQKNYSSREAKEERTVLYLSLTPWVGLPVIIFFNLGQAIEVTVTNAGFLLLFALQLKNHITQLRNEHKQLVESENRLLNWNTSLQREVEKRTYELQKANEQRATNFVNLAHEMKTPLTLMNNYFDEYLQQHGSTPELNIVKNGLNKLTTDITNLFDIERFNRDMTVYNHQQIICFNEFLCENLQLFQALAKRRGLQIQSVIKEGIYIKADPSALNRIINNLLDNAIKFSGDGNIVLVSLETNAGNAQFAVKDYGAGVPAEYVKRIFNPYYQINNAKKKNNQGMGLGLPIVKMVVESLGGNIKVESNPQVEPGATFTVTIPLTTKGDADQVITHYVEGISYSLEEPRADFEIVMNQGKSTILLVEDNVSMANYLFSRLKEKYNVFVAFNGSDALKKITDEQFPIPDLIITDIMMDKMDGMAFAKVLNQNTAFKHIPVIFLSAKSTQTDRIAALQIGAVDFLQKPFSINELQVKIGSILNTIANQKKALLNSALKTLAVIEQDGQQEPGGSEENKFDTNTRRFKLTPQEKNIAQLIFDEGLKSKEIAARLFISERTVTKHLQNIYEKLGVSSRVELIKKLDA